MDPLGAIRRAQERGLDLRLEPPAARPDSPLAEVLAVTRAIDGPFGRIDFTGESLDVEIGELFPAGVPIATDGAGNFWVVDHGRVYFFSHDPPVVVLQSTGLGAFLEEAFEALVARGLTSEAPVTSIVEADLRFTVFDLREALPGTGFEWGQHGPGTLLTRYGDEPLFGVGAPERRRRRMFGRRG